MSKPKVLLLGSVDYAVDAWKAFCDTVEIVKPASTNRADFLKECHSGNLNGVVAAYRTFFSYIWDEELVNALPKSLKFCCHHGAGYDQINIHACSARDPPIHVSNVPTAVDDATADTAIFLMLGALRGFNVSMKALRDGEFRGKPMPPLGHDPEGKTLGILGMGGKSTRPM